MQLLSAGFLVFDALSWRMNLDSSAISPAFPFGQATQSPMVEMQAKIPVSKGPEFFLSTSLTLINTLDLAVS